MKSSEENSYADRFTLSVSIASENLSKKSQHENCSCQLKTLNSYHEIYQYFEKIIFSLNLPLIVCYFFWGIFPTWTSTITTKNITSSNRTAFPRMYQSTIITLAFYILRKLKWISAILCLTFFSYLFTYRSYCPGTTKGIRIMYIIGSKRKKKK